MQAQYGGPGLPTISTRPAHHIACSNMVDQACPPYRLHALRPAHAVHHIAPACSGTATSITRSQLYVVTILACPPYRLHALGSHPYHDEPPRHARRIWWTRPAHHIAHMPWAVTHITMSPQDMPDAVSLPRSMAVEMMSWNVTIFANFKPKRCMKPITVM